MRTAEHVLVSGTMFHLMRLFSSHPLCSDEEGTDFCLISLFVLPSPGLAMSTSHCVDAKLLNFNVIHMKMSFSLSLNFLIPVMK